MTADPYTEFLKAVDTDLKSDAEPDGKMIGIWEGRKTMTSNWLAIPES